MTLLSSDDFLPGAQTLLYSIQKTLDKSILYPPESVVLATPEVSQKTRDALWPALCTRILDVSIIPFHKGINGKVPTKVDGKAWDNHNPGLTKLHAFRLEVYDTIVFIEPDCLVLEDVYPLIKRGKVYTETEALVAAAPDLFPPDRFNSGVMVIRPSQSTFDNMMGQRSLLANYDGSDTGFLNGYFPEWYTEMAPLARLPFTYNAQRALYDTTYKQGHSCYWDVAIAPDLKILHYSGGSKPWEVNVRPQGLPKDDSGAPPSLTARTGDDLTDLWCQWYQRSKNFVARYHKEKEKEQAWKDSAKVHQQQQEQQAAAKQAADPRRVHKLVSKRFKELRQDGHGTKDAMAMARAEHGLEDSEPVSVGAQVASMFGVML